MVGELDTPNLETRRQLKVMVPARLLVGLRSLKVLDGTEISEAVTQALAVYLAEETEA